MPEVCLPGACQVFVAGLRGTAEGGCPVHGDGLTGRFTMRANRNRVRLCETTAGVNGFSLQKLRFTLKLPLLEVSNVF